MLLDIFGEAKNLAGRIEYFGNNAVVYGATPVRRLRATLENRVCADSATINVFFYFCIHA